LYGLRISVLGILNQKNHQKCDDGCTRIYHQLPRIAEVENGASHDPNGDD